MVLGKKIKQLRLRLSQVDQEIVGGLHAKGQITECANGLS
jgi:hypothetical protein